MLCWETSIRSGRAMLLEACLFNETIISRSAMILRCGNRKNVQLRCGEESVRVGCGEVEGWKSGVE